MQSFIKKIFFGALVLVFAFSLANKSGAQTLSSMEQDVKSFYDTFPEIYIDDISLPKTEYKAGETVTGSFVIRNGKDFYVPDVSYDVSLAGNYNTNGLAGLLYEKVRQGPINLGANESREVNFSYKIPEALSGTKFGIHVNAVLKDGLTLGWNDLFIKVTDGKSALVLGKTLVSANGKTYGLQDGPTIKKNDPASLKITLNNPNTESITVIPKITLKKFIAGGAPVEVKMDAVTLNKKSSKEVSLALNTNYDPAVYEGSVSFIDASGLDRAPVAEFRYIIGGDIINFQSVSADKTVLKKADSFNVSILYSGAPFDIDSDPSVAPKENTVNISVKIFNEIDVLVAEYSNLKFDFNTGNKLSLPLSALVDSKALRAEISVSRDGVVISKYNRDLSSDYAQARKATLDSQKSDFVKKMILIASIIVALLVVIFLSLKFLKNKSSIAMLVALFAVLSIFSSANKAQAFVIDSWSTPEGTTVQDASLLELGVTRGAIVTINEPSGYYAPGEIFNPSGTIRYVACGNRPAFRLKITAFIGSQSKTITLDQNYTNPNEYAALSDSFSFDSFIASKALGSTQSMKFIIDTYSLKSDGTIDEHWVHMEGHQNFYIMTKPILNFSANPTSVDSGGSTALLWSVPNDSSSAASSAFYADPNRSLRCDASGDWGGINKTFWDKSTTTPKNFSKAQTETIGGITSAKTFSLQCFKTYHGISIASDKESVNIALAASDTTKGAAEISRVMLVGSSLVPVNFDTTAKFNGTQKTDKPAMFANATPGSYTFGTSQKDGYTLRAGTCTYPIGSPECFLSKASDYTMVPTCANGFCSVDFSVIKGVVSKVDFLYGTSQTTTLTVEPSSKLVCDSTAGSASLITWTSTGATSCVGTNFSTGIGNATAGSISTGPLSGSKTYSVACTNNTSGITVSAEAEVVCGGVPTSSVDLTVDSTSVACNGTSLLKWTSSNVVSNSCVGTNFNTGGSSVNQTGVTTAPISAITPYTIKCTKSSGGEVSDTVTVTPDCASPGSLEIKRVKLVNGVYEKLVTPTTDAWYDGVSKTSENEYTFKPVAAGVHAAKVSVPAGYAVTGVATCDTLNCTLTSSSNYTATGLTCASDGASCSYNATVVADKTTRVVFLYTPKDLTATLTANPSSGPATLSVGLNASALGSLVAKRASQVAGIHGSLAANSILLTYTFTCGNGTTASYPTVGPTIAVTANSTCTYPTPGSFIAKVTVTGGGQTAVGEAAITVGSVSSTNGAFLIKRVDDQGNKISGTTVIYDGGTAVVDNPKIYTDRSGTHTVKISTLGSYPSMSVRQCQYDIPASGVVSEANEQSCSSATVFSTITPANPTDQFVSKTIDAIPGKVLKLEFKYSASQSSGEVGCYTDSDNEEVYTGVPVTWRVSGGDGSTYKWVDGIEPHTMLSDFSASTSFTKVYTTTGNKSVWLYTSKNGVQSGPFICTVGVNGPVTTVKVIVNPGIIEI